MVEENFLTDLEEKKSLNKVVISVFFAHKKDSRSFIKLQLNYWYHMDYFNNVLTTFLGLECVSCVAVYAARVRKLWISSKISYSVPKMNEGLMDLEWHDSE